MIAKSIPQNEKRLIMKFGSSCIKEPASFDPIAELLIESSRKYHNIVVVVSAMGNWTDQLISLAHQVHPSPPKREYDMLVSVGERVSIALLAMALAKRGEEAISFTGSQSGIITSNDHSDAEIVAVEPIRILEAFKKYKIVIVAGFQGVSRTKEITTLGRGGSDITAVALGSSLQASHVVFFKDVPGIAAHDPKVDPEAPFYTELSYDDALTIAKQSERAVIHPRALLLAQKDQIPLEVTNMKTCEGKTRIHETKLSKNCYL